MSYETEPHPYDRPHEQMSASALRKAFAIVREQMPRRICCISEHLNHEHGIMITPTSSDEDINKLPALIAALGTWRPLSEDEFEAQLVGTRPQAIEVMRALLPRKMLSGETLAMVFDAALLWGEAFRIRYPAARWDIGAKPTDSVDYGDPVLVGFGQYHSEFGVSRQMHGQVGVIMSGDRHEWTLTRIMKMRAFEFGLGPNPYFEPKVE